MGIRRPSILIAVVLLSLAAGCKSGSPTINEYADDSFVSDHDGPPRAVIPPGPGEAEIDESSQTLLSGQAIPNAPSAALADAGSMLARTADSNIYAGTMGPISPPLAGITPRVYVPNNGDGTLTVIDPISMTVVDRYSVGSGPHHVTPSWDMSVLYVNNTSGSTLTVIDPASGKVSRTLEVEDPYNLYFTPDGSRAIVVAEREQRLDVRDPKTWALIGSVHIPGRGPDHLDWTADGRELLISTEWDGYLYKVDPFNMRVTGELNVGGLPIDIKLSPDGTVFYVANQGRHGVSIVDPTTMTEIAFLSTDKGAHGLCISRDTRSIYVSNRLAGSVSVIDVASRKVTQTWSVGGSPDMLQVSPDGSQLWTADRYHDTVSVYDTTSGSVLKRFNVGSAPHGLTYFPQQGRFSVGHNGVYR